MAKKLHLVLFGSGRIGTVHFENTLINERAQITWIVEPEIHKAQALVEKYNMADRVKVTNSCDEALADKRVDGVLVCTHHQMHSEITQKALKAGKAVFCEKPLSLSIDETMECYSLAKSCNLPLMCAFNRRFDPSYRLVYNRVRSGEVGEVRVVNICCRDPKAMVQKSYLKTSGGVFLDSMIHQIDLACFMVGEVAETVYATGHAYDKMYADCDDIDTAFVILKYPSGAMAQLQLARHTDIGHDQRLEVLGSKGLLQVENQRPVEVLQWDDKSVKMEGIYSGLERYYPSYKQEVQHFIDVLQAYTIGIGCVDLEVSSQSVISSAIIAVACKTSLDTQTTVNIKHFAKEHYNYII